MMAARAGRGVVGWPPSNARPCHQSTDAALFQKYDFVGDIHSTPVLDQGENTQKVVTSHRQSCCLTRQSTVITHTVAR